MADALIGSALASYKAGVLDGWLRHHSKIASRLRATLLLPLLGSGLGSESEDAPNPPAFAVLLAWGVALLRPDGRVGFDGIARLDWLERTSWRPMLAVMCHYGFAPVPEFRDRYRPRPDESAVDSLCGLWSVGPSTFYRYVDKGKRLLAQALLQQPMDAQRRLSLRSAALGPAYAQLGLVDAEARKTWHRDAARRCLARHDGGAGLWHLLNAGDVSGFVQALQRHSGELGADHEVDLMISMLASRPLDSRQHVELTLAQGAVHRARSHEQRERECYERALQMAAAAGDKLMVGIVYAAIGKFQELRDTDRAFACYEESADFLRQAGLTDSGQTDSRATEEYLRVLTQLAWMHVLRNDPRARSLLERADALRSKPSIPAETIGQLDQTWGEYWRRSGDLQLALSYKHRALSVFERLGDQPQILSTYNNLSLLYGETKEFEKAADYAQRVLALAERSPVDPYVVANTHLNLGVSLYWQGRYGEAIPQYLLSLKKAEEVGLQVVIGRAHYNLAEAFYKSFQASHDAEDERRGDTHAAAAHKVWSAEHNAEATEATLGLKSEILGRRDGGSFDRLLPGEAAVHFLELADVQRQRDVLALPLEAEAHVRAHLGIANAYLAISMKEREAALALIDKHGLGDSFASQLDTLRNTFDRELTREQRLAAQWKEAASDLLGDERRAAVLGHVLHSGSINKSGYAELCGVGAATASKHLGTLAERGLLVQTGKGPSTRYLLPDG